VSIFFKNFEEFFAGPKMAEPSRAGMDAGCFHSPGFSRGENPGLKNGTEAVLRPRKG
jgi:hypothetical protein